MKLYVPTAAIEGGPPWTCSECRRTVDADQLDEHLLDHLRQQVIEIDGPHHCPEATLRRVLAKWWRRMREWWRRRW